MSPLRRELVAITRLALPVAASQLATMALWVVDLMMIGPIGVEALDAAALGRLWLMGTLVFDLGLVMGIDPLVTQAHGARNKRLLGATLQRGMVVAALVSLPTAVLWLFTDRFLVLTGQEPHLAAEALSYARVQIPGIPLFLLFMVIRQYLLGRGIVAPCVWVAVLANPVNAFGNWILIYGRLGLPALGIVGAGIATAITQGFMLAALAGWVVAARLGRGGWAGWSREALRLRGLLPILRHGVPIGVQISLEFWAFLIANLLAGWLGATALASHSIAINLASVAFMLPLGVSIGVVTRVGNLIGRRNPAGAQRAAWVGFALGGGVMSASALVFVVARRWLPALYTRDLDVVTTCAALLPIVAAFQLFDGLQVVGGGILRGMGRTRPAAVFNLVGYYALALPLAYWLGFPLGYGLRGVWWGLALGLAAIAVALVVWVALRGPARVDARVIETGSG